MKNFKRIAVVLVVAVMILTTFAACGSPAKKMIGEWKDSTGVAGYNFKEDGTVDITYLDINIPIIGDVNGTYTGTYSVNKKDDGEYYVTISASIYGIAMNDEYKVAVEDANLTLTKVNDDGTLGNAYSYIRQSAE